MKGEIKSYRVPKSRGLKCDVRTLCGKLILTADSDADALLLAAIAYGIFPVGNHDRPRVEKIYDLRQEAMRDYCVENDTEVRQGQIVPAKSKAKPKPKGTGLKRKAVPA